MPQAINLRITAVPGGNQKQQEADERLAEAFTRYPATSIADEVTEDLSLNAGIYLVVHAETLAVVAGAVALRITPCADKERSQEQAADALAEMLTAHSPSTAKTLASDIWSQTGIFLDLKIEILGNAPTAAPPVGCQMRADCTDPVTHLDQNGFLYCTNHGLQRRASRPCRKLRPHELTRLKRGGQITKY